MATTAALIWQAHNFLPLRRQDLISGPALPRKQKLVQCSARQAQIPANSGEWGRKHAAQRIHNLEIAGGVAPAPHPRDVPEKWPVSVIIPVYNEKPNLPMLLEKVGQVMRKRDVPYEILCVDDGSTDGSSALLKAMAAERMDLRAVILRRNFGQTAAMAAGFDLAAGQLVVTLDGDLQNDAEDIPRLLDHLLYGAQEEASTSRDGRVSTAAREDGGYDLVCGWRRRRKDNFFSRNLPSAIANWIIGAATGVKLHDYGCSLKAYRASAVANIKLYGELHRFIPALAAIEGATIAELEVNHSGRAFGSSKYGLGRIPRVIVDLITVCCWAKFRDRPMQLIGLVGGLCLLASMGTASVAGVSIYSASLLSGWQAAFQNMLPSLVLSLELFVMGLQCIFLGLVADICMKTYFESQPRPVYRIREIATSGWP